MGTTEEHVSNERIASDDRATARRAWGHVEPVHDIVYFAPNLRARTDAAGLRGFWMAYFAMRSAPLGAAPAEFVTATFYGFHPHLVQRALPDAWHRLDPSAVLELRKPSPLQASKRPPRIGLCRTPLWEVAQPETVAAFEDAAERLARAGAQIKSVTLPDEFAGLRHAARETINNYERAAAMGPEWEHHRDGLSERLRARLELGRAMPHAEYLAAIRLGQSCRARLPSIFQDFDVLLAPCANGEAPRGLGETGDPGFQAIWTILHTPSLSMPTHRGPNGLPVAIQLVGNRHDDRHLLACAQWIWQRKHPVHPANASEAWTSGADPASAASETFPHGVSASRDVASETGQANRHIFGQNSHSSAARRRSRTRTPPRGRP